MRGGESVQPGQPAAGEAAPAPEDSEQPEATEETGLPVTKITLATNTAKGPAVGEVFTDEQSIAALLALLPAEGAEPLPPQERIHPDEDQNMRVIMKGYRGGAEDQAIQATFTPGFVACRMDGVDLGTFSLPDGAYETVLTMTGWVGEPMSDTADDPRGQEVTAVTLTHMKSGAKKTYDIRQDILLLIHYLPGKKDALSGGQNPEGGDPVCMEVYKGEALQWVYEFSPGYAVRTNADDSPGVYTVPEGVYDRLLEMTGSGQEPALYFRGQPVAALYSLDAANRSYHLVEDPAVKARVLELLSDSALNSFALEKAGGDLGFLLFYSDGGKVPVYIRSDAGDAALADLARLSAESNAGTPHHAQWFCYMSPENIKSIQFGGVAGISADSAGSAVSVSVDTENRDSITAAAAFLKTFEVQPAPSVATGEEGMNNPVTTADLYHLTIHFYNGVQYTAFGNEGLLSLTSSDMPEQITYRCDDDKLRAFMRTLPDATTTPWPPED